MEEKLESMYSNGVYGLIETLERIKPMKVYKKKRMVNGKVATYKAKLVEKSYSQKLGFDYEEIFSLVAILKSIIILISIVAHFDYEISKMNVKTLFFEW